MKAYYVSSIETLPPPPEESEWRFQPTEMFLSLVDLRGSIRFALPTRRILRGKRCCTLFFHLLGSRRRPFRENGQIQAGVLVMVSREWTAFMEDTASEVVRKKEQFR